LAFARRISLVNFLYCFLGATGGAGKARSLGLFPFNASYYFASSAYWCFYYNSSAFFSSPINIDKHIVSNFIINSCIASSWMNLEHI